LLLPNNLSEKEQASYLAEKNRIKADGYISKIDDIIQIKDLNTLFVK